MDIARHDADLTFSRLNDAGAVRANKSSFGLRLHNGLHLNHIQSGNTFSDANNKVHFSFDSFKNSISGKRRRNVKNRSLSSSFLLSFSHIFKDGKTQVLCTSLAMVNTTDHVGAISNSAFSVESTVLASHTLADDLGVLVDKDVGFSTGGVGRETTSSCAKSGLS